MSKIKTGRRISYTTKIVKNMQNVLTKRNFIIIAVILALIIIIGLYIGLKPDRTTGMENGGFFGGLFPTTENPEGGALTRQAPGTNGQAATPGSGQITETQNLPLAQEASKNLPIGTLIRLTNDNISSLQPASTSVRYHKNIPENLGHLFQRKPDGTNEEVRIANFTIPQILRVVWSPDGNKAIIFYTLDKQTRKLLVDYSSQTPKTNFLPDTVLDAVFSPDSKSLAFINDLGDTRNIFIATSDFKNQKKIYDNRVPNFEISWPAATFVSLKTKSSYAYNGYMYTLNINNKVFDKVAEGRGLDAVWNKDGSGFIYSTVNSGGRMQNIKFFDMKSGKEKEIAAKTLAEKCVFLKTLKNIAYCAVPNNPNPAKYPDEWWQGKIAFGDDINLVDGETGQISFFVPAPVDAINPKIMSDDSYILFRDKNTGALWSLKLK